MKEKTKSGMNLLIAGIALAIVGAAGYMYINRDTTGEDLLIGIPISTEAEGQVDGELLSALRQLRDLELDRSIFDDPTWLTLYDFGQTLTPQPKGRPNPFAPIE